MRGWVVLVVGLMSVGGVALAQKKYPPAMHTFGPLLATPPPSPERQDKIRLITSITIQNRPDGDSTIAFEATDFAKAEKKEHRILATEVYSLVEPKPELEPIADKIMQDIRALEAEMLDYVKAAGPPRERQTILEQGAPQRPGTGAPARGR